MEVKGINPALEDMIGRGQLSVKKIAALIHLREFVDGYAACNHLSDEEVEKVKGQFGVEPDVVSWGDYFQTEIGSRHFAEDDDEFARIIQTARFDIISAGKIFAGKPEAFLEAVKAGGEIALGVNQADWTLEQEEAAHLYILCNYFQEMKLEEAVLNAADDEWFQGFMEEADSAVG